MQQRKYDWLLDAAWLRDEDFVESSEPVMRSELDADAYELATWHMVVFAVLLRVASVVTCSSDAQVQVVWRIIKAKIREYATRGDKVLPFLLNFRDIVERLSHHLMVERLVAICEAGPACDRHG